MLTASDLHKVSSQLRKEFLQWLEDEGQDSKRINAIERHSGLNEVPIYKITLYDTHGGRRFIDDSKKDVATYRVLFEASKESPLETNGGTL